MKFDIVEFNGLPGSGKSTITRKLIEVLRSRGLVVLSEGELFPQSERLSKIGELITGLAKPRLVRLNMALVALGVRASIKAMTLKNVKNAIRMIRYNYLLYRRSEQGDFDVICLSEGLVQFLSCIVDGLEFLDMDRFDAIWSEMQRLYPDMLVISCSIAKEQALERVRMRTSEPNSVDLMESSQREQFFSIRYSNMTRMRESLVRSALETYEIDTADEIDVNVKRLCRKLSV